MATGRSARLTPLLAVVGLLLTGTAAPVAAECTRLSPWPSFVAGAPSARDIYVVRVVESLHDTFDGPRAPTPLFRIEVETVLRGEGPDELEVRGYRSGAPQPYCPGDSALWVHVGDRLAFATDARVPGIRGRIGPVAFVDDSRPDRDLAPRIEQLPLARIIELAELPRTDAQPGIGTQPSAGPDTRLAVIVLATIAAMLVTWQRVARRRI
ncbi:MAG: hypothetical protein KF809_12375 [Chloroflexi bacterium]|nr:hypothetical protein [Chloroflexota bacterium]